MPAWRKVPGDGSVQELQSRLEMEKEVRRKAHRSLGLRSRMGRSMEGAGLCSTGAELLPKLRKASANQSLQH